MIYATYVLSGALGGLAGVLVAFTVGHIVPEYAFWLQSGEFVFVALLGGTAASLGRWSAPLPLSLFGPTPPSMPPTPGK